MLSLQPDTFVTFEEMTEKLVQEITHHIEAYNLFPTKIRFVSFVFLFLVAVNVTPCASETLRDNPINGYDADVLLYTILVGYPTEKDIPSVTPKYFHRDYIHNKLNLGQVIS